MLRHRLRRLSTLKRVRKCGYCTAGAEGGGPGLRLTANPKGGNIAGFSGLATCGSVWACPVCSAKIATRRAEELADVMRFGARTGVQREHGHADDSPPRRPAAQRLLGRGIERLAVGHLGQAMGIGLCEVWAASAGCEPSR